MKMNIFNWHSLKTRVTLFTLAIFLLSMWSLAFFASRMLHTDMERVLGEQQFATVSMVAAEVDEELERRLQALKDVTARVTPAMMGNPAALQTLLEEHVVTQSLFDAGVMVHRLDGTVVAEMPLSAGRIGSSFIDREDVVATLKDGKSMIGKPHLAKSKGNPEFGLAVPIRDAQGKVIGALRGEINLKAPNFLDKITLARYGKTGGYLLVAPQHNLIVTATDKSRIMQPIPAPGVNLMNDRYMQGYNGFGIALNAARIEEFSSVQRVPVAGWFVAAVLPAAEAFAPVHKLQQNMLLTTLMLTLLAGALTWWMLRRELLPMVTAARTLTTLSDAGQAPQAMPIARQDEIGKLIAAFNSVLATLKESEQRYRSLVEWSPEAIAVHRSGKLVYVNPATIKMLGARSELDLIGKPILDLVHPDSRQTVLAPTGSDFKLGIPQPMTEEKLIKRDGSTINVEVRFIATTFNGLPATQVALRDITESKKAQEQIQNLAFSDPLTGLHNRRLLMDRLQQALVASIRHQRQGALLLVDLDDFKSLNDTLGHYKGDLLLQQVAKRLLTCVREGDTVARVGGDEFVVLLEDLSQNAQEAASQAEAVGEKIIAALNQPYQLGGYPQHSTCSTGITLFGGVELENIEEPLKWAEMAMYQAKAAGRNTLRFFDPKMQAAVMSRSALETGLREALKNNQFLLHYQAQVTDKGQIMGVEALVRWQDPRRGLVPPAEFIGLAEETGLILPLGQWVLETACKQLTLWASQPTLSHLTIAVIVSARQFHQSDFVAQVLATLARTGANPQRLKLELTESLLVANVEDVIAKMSALKSHGVSFSLDDFGTGYSSLSYLKRLPLDQLKIDISFVRDILTDKSNAAIAKTVIDLAENLGLTVIAEGVEIEGQRDLLAYQGCHAYQGYLFSQPLPLAEFEALAKKV